MLDVGIKETTTTTGSGTVTLSAASGFLRVSDRFGVGDAVAYRIKSGNGDLEWGIGRVGAGNTLARSIIVTTVVSGVVTDGGSPIGLTGSSEVIVTEHTQAAAGGGTMQIIPAGSVVAYQVPFAVAPGNLSNSSAVGNKLYVVPWMVSTPVKWTQIGMATTAAVAGQTASVGVYESRMDDDWVCRPGRLLYQSPEMDLTASGDKITTGLSFRPKVGRVYWSYLRCSASTSVRTLSQGSMQAHRGWKNASIYPYGQYIVDGYFPTIPTDLSSTGVSDDSLSPFIYFVK